MSTASEHARLIAVGLPVGNTLPNSICPVCGGGEKRKVTFAVTRYPNKLAYICYRDSCGVRGYVNDEGRTDFKHDHALNTGGKQKIRPYEGSIKPLEDSDHEYFEERFELPVNVRDSIRIGDHDTYLFPILGPMGEHLGHVVRQPTWKGNPSPPRGDRSWTGPKALTRMKIPGEAISFHSGIDCWASVITRDKWILVEDSVSALKLAAYGYNAIALLSTNVNLAKVRAMQEVGAKQILIALDADATQTAFKIARDYGLAFDKTKVIIMRQDVKDTPAEDFTELFGET